MALIEIHIHNPDATKVVEGLIKLGRDLKSHSHIVEIKMAELDDKLSAIKAKIEAQDTQLDGVRELIVGLREQLLQLPNLSEDQRVALDAIMSGLDKNAQEIVDAVNAGTPAENQPTT